MFVRLTPNRSGSRSVQVISKHNGRYRVVKTFGSSADPNEMERMKRSALDFVENPGNQLSLLATLSKEDMAIENFVEDIANFHVRTIGPELIFGALFDRIGFGVIPEKLFRHITIARLAYPASKLKTADYLYRYRSINVSEDSIYKFLDKLNDKYKETVQKIAYEHTKQALGGSVSVVFYDMTTLYFEAEDEDDLRKIGFSKDGKFQHPQIMLGLLVGKGGLPIGYDIFEGNTFEGHTLLPTLRKIQKKYAFKNPTVVADAALLSKENIENLGKAEYRFIIGARIKNEAESVKAQILKLAPGTRDGGEFTVKKQDGTRLIVTYKTKRARKDAHNRERGLKKLRLQIKSGRLAKEHINNRGYNKFLSLTGNMTVEINEEKIKQDKLWDGLKGYVTNTRMSSKAVVEQYGHLWQIEQAFRISKTDLKIRPVFHYRKRRIEAHICVCFAAYTIWKDLECLLRRRRIDMSPKRAAELTHNMYELNYTLPHSKREKRKALKMDSEQLALYGVIHNIM